MRDEQWKATVIRGELPFVWTWEVVYSYSEDNAGGAHIVGKGIALTKRGAWRAARNQKGKTHELWQKTPLIGEMAIL